MRRPLPPSLLTLFALFALAAALPAAAAVEQTIERDLALDGASAVQVKIPVGDLEVQAADGGRVAVRVEVRCSPDGGSRCGKAAERVRLDVRRSAGWLVLAVEGFPKVRSHGLSADVHVTVPRALRFQADLGVGEVEVAGLENDVEVDVGVGDVRLILPAARVRSVELDAGVGEASLVIGGRRVEGKGLVGKGLEWSQEEGAAHVEVDCGVGDIEIELVE